MQTEDTELLKAITQPKFLFIANMTHQMLILLDPPNTALQAKSTDLYTGVRLIQSALKYVVKLRCDLQFDTIWEKFSQDRQTTETPAAPSQKRATTLSHLSDQMWWTPHLVTVKRNQKRRMGVKDSGYYRSEDFLNTNKLRPMFDLIGIEMKEAVFAGTQKKHVPQKKRRSHPDGYEEGHPQEVNYRVERDTV
ncbi:unnamed protein product [Lepeophtheirus salmonis]|uniref:(salmon louse) hypothetical protein n=1 Tax=Lepeophtheirus salmonis TaxID=72036 RepID=A0A7R8CT52_LEPSM|nr:unnamed protein product [Lepeophtheirus salmonis]CAF2922941.1 unnamed protein product [Lepeophtheirus salmonis]